MTIWDGVQRGYIPGETLRIPGTLKLHAGTADVDPVTFEVIRYSLMNTNLEHGQTIQRLAVSPVTMITRDFQPSITTETGELVFLGPYLQYFSTAQALTIKWILENRSENPGIEPGDMFVSNDPYVGSPHQPDTARPARAPRHRSGRHVRLPRPRRRPPAPAGHDRGRPGVRRRQIVLLGGHRHAPRGRGRRGDGQLRRRQPEEHTSELHSRF